MDAKIHPSFVKSFIYYIVQILLQKYYIITLYIAGAGKDWRFRMVIPHANSHAVSTIF